MAKAKFLHFLTRRGSSLKSSSNGSKKDVAVNTAVSNESDTPKIREEVLMLLNNFPESESESDRELSFSFLLSNSLPEKEDDDVLEKGGKTEDQLSFSFLLSNSLPEKEDDDVLEKGGKTEDQHSFSFSATAKEKKQRKLNRSGGSSCGERISVLLNLHVPASFIKSRSGRVTPCRTLAELEKR